MFNYLRSETITAPTCVGINDVQYIVTEVNGSEDIATLTFWGLPSQKEAGAPSEYTLFIGDIEDYETDEDGLPVDDYNCAIADILPKDVKFYGTNGDAVTIYPDEDTE